MYCARSKALGFGAVLLAQAALELLHRVVFVLLHPGDQVALDRRRSAATPCRISDGAEHRHVRARHEHLQHVGGAVDAAGGGQVGLERPYSIAIQRSGTRIAIGVLSRMFGLISSVSRSMSGW